MSNKKNKILIISPIIILFLIIIVIIIIFSINKPNKIKHELNEKGFPIYKKPTKQTVENADYYVSIKTGDDNNIGTKSHPFKTITKAQETVRKLIKNNSNLVDKDITIAIMGGEYNLKKELSFNKNDNLPNNHKITYTSYNEEEVILSGGINFKALDFKKLSNEDSLRLPEKSRENVKVVNLFESGLTKEEIGKLYAIGGFSQGKKYGEDNGVALEVFYDGKRMSLAKYPNNGFSKIGQIIDYGEASEHVPDIIDWYATPSPRPPKFRVDEDMKSHMSKWKKPTSDLNSIWAYGYFYWDWADVSSPVNNFDSTLGQLDLKYSSTYGIREGQIYYVYNVFEELDNIGEYYIDRENGNFYIYFPDEHNQNSRITLSMLSKHIIHSYQVENITIDGMTVECSRTKGLDMLGSNITIKNMIIKNVGYEGIRIQGNNNLITDNEIKNVGKSGIVCGTYLNYKEGNIDNDIRKDGLRIENNIIKNNYIHAYGETSRSQIAGVYLFGVGNKVSHNEIFDSPSTAILYIGNEHIIEYNYIHHVVKKSSDAGAIYSGRNLSFFGNIIRYNAIMDIGSEHFTPNGIYFDDCLAGQTAYGNLLVNIPGNGFLIGGGRENKIFDNTIINSKNPIHYDSRAYDGLNGGWYKKNVETPNSRQWNLLKDAQKLYENWLKDPESIKIMNKSEADYSKIKKMLGFNNKLEPDSAATPNSRVYNNIVVSKNKFLGSISETVKKYAKVENNSIYNIDEDIVKESFVNFIKGNYLIKKDSIIAKENKNYNKIPYHLIGRINF